MTDEKKYQTKLLILIKNFRYELERVALAGKADYITTIRFLKLQLFLSYHSTDVVSASSKIV